MQAKKVILLEFNELCPNLIDKFCAQGKLPNFSKLAAQSQKFITDASCDVEYLEPWIQWVTLHTGVSCEQHRVYRLGEAQNLQQDSIWDRLSKQGLRSWLCGGMNIKYDPNDPNIWALPDPWSADGKASPAELDSFYQFVRANVQEHSNDNFQLSAKDYTKFFNFMLKHGLSLATLKHISSVFWHRFTSDSSGWRKATILDWLQTDVFAYGLKKFNPHFSVLFSNSTAHFQHKYWRYMEPDKFSAPADPAKLAEFGQAIEYAYQNHDKLIGRVLAMADEDTCIMLSSALSQQPFTAEEAQGGRRFYRPTNFDKLVALFELPGLISVMPVMSHQFHIQFASEQQASEAMQILAQANFSNGTPLLKLVLEGDRVFAGCNAKVLLDNEVTFEIEHQPHRFFDYFYMADNIKSGMHHPDGVFWISQQQPSAQQTQRIQLTQATSLILQQFQAT
ncbi:alkaline phosphatase family protein [Thalassotalea ponticola]|uniref:alkaline phosphatase family protein n=1 Tax=Thalassotalea ponticola TaxID=1523392 RepID=UPI0025B5AAE6|nr:alkaline phosphatase family protein [Thalassotalea ponticola]MDN3652414.1 alkaline phosphatase family protein [Thalassotalea ponticola]